MENVSIRDLKFKQRLRNANENETSDVLRDGIHFANVPSFMDYALTFITLANCPVPGHGVEVNLDR